MSETTSHAAIMQLSDTIRELNTQRDALAESHAELVAALESAFSVLVNRPNRNYNALDEAMKRGFGHGDSLLGFQVLAEEAIKNALPVLDKARALVPEAK